MWDRHCYRRRRSSSWIHLRAQAVNSEFVLQNAMRVWSARTNTWCYQQACGPHVPSAQHLFLNPRQPKALHAPRATRPAPRAPCHAPRPRPTHPRPTSHAPRHPRGRRAPRRARPDHVAASSPPARACVRMVPSLDWRCGRVRRGAATRCDAALCAPLPSRREEHSGKASRQEHRARQRAKCNTPRATADEVTRTEPPVRHGPDSPDRHQLVTNAPAPRRNAAQASSATSARGRVGACG